MRLKIYGRADSHTVVDEDTGETLAIFQGGDYPFNHRAFAEHYKRLLMAVMENPPA